MCIWFSLTLGLMGAVLLPAWLVLSEGLTFQFLTFLSVVGIFFVAATPHFLEKSEGTVHRIGAFLAAGAGLAWCFIYSPIWWVVFIYLGVWGIVSEQKHGKGLDDVRRGWAYYTNTLEYADKNQLPILFHYDIDDVEDYVGIMEGMLIRYPGVKFVHAHCGVTKPLLLKQDTRAIFDHERQLVENFDNYYLDLSWEVNKLFDVTAFIFTLPETKWVIGSDTSANLCNTHYNKYQELKNDFDNLFIFHEQSTNIFYMIY